MRTIERTSQFKRDFKRIQKQHLRDLETRFPILIEALAKDEPLEPRYRDHALTGNWVGTRECHIRPDLLLIYQKIDDRLILVRLGSHAELFG